MSTPALREPSSLRRMTAGLAKLENPVCTMFSPMTWTRWPLASRLFLTSLAIRGSRLVKGMLQSTRGESMASWGPMPKSSILTMSWVTQLVMRRPPEAPTAALTPLPSNTSAGVMLLRANLPGMMELMRPGDILTHCFTGNTMRIVEESGNLRETVKRAWDAGLVLDIGHGAGSFSFKTAEALMAQGYRPDVISSDIHQMSVSGPMFDMPTCLSKFLSLGMSFAEVIRAATERPAAVLGLEKEVGTLRPGALADVALFEIVEGDFMFYDVFMNPRPGRQLVRHTLTILNGREMAHQSDDPLMPWIELSEAQQTLIAQGHTPPVMAANCNH